MNLDNSVQLIHMIIESIAPVSVLLVLTNRAYNFLISAFTGGHRNL